MSLLTPFMTFNVMPLTDDPEFKAPLRKSYGAAGYDIFAPYDLVLRKDQLTTIKCGFAAEFFPVRGSVHPKFGSFGFTGMCGVEVEQRLEDFGIDAEVVPRSGFGGKRGMVIANTIGIMDIDYRGEWMIMAYIQDKSWWPDELIIPKGEAFAQVVFKQTLVQEGGAMSPNIVTELSDTVRGEGGYGSTNQHVKL
jgi:dUTPase